MGIIGSGLLVQGVRKLLGVEVLNSISPHEQHWTSNLSFLLQPISAHKVTASSITMDATRLVPPCCLGSMPELTASLLQTQT